MALRRPRGVDADDEQIALSRNPQVRALLERSRESMRHKGTKPFEDLEAFRDLTSEDEAEGDELLTEMERQTSEGAVSKSVA